ncbi:MAG: hypothetical protein NVS2B16_26170 [Chloroflexota bacterium]
MMRLLIQLSATLAAVSLLILPDRVLAYSGKATMPMIGFRILSPAPGAVNHSNAVSVRVGITHWQLNCAWVGKVNNRGMGHYHIMLDGALVNMYSSDNASVSLQNERLVFIS